MSLSEREIDKLIKALNAHHVETEIVKKVGEVSTKQETPLINVKTKIQAVAPCHSLSPAPCNSFSPVVAKSSPLVRTLHKRKSVGIKLQTPTPNNGRKRRDTFELDEASLQGSTPTIDGQSEKQRKPSQRKSTGSEISTDHVSDTNGIKLQTPTPNNGRKRRDTFELDEASLQGSTPTIDGQTEKQTRKSSQRKSTGSEISAVHVSDTYEDKLQTPNQIGGRKRRRTFELDEASLQEDTPTIDDKSGKKSRQSSLKGFSTESAKRIQHSSKRQRRSTDGKDSHSFSDSAGKKISKLSSSPGTKAIIESMDTNGSSAERREKLLSAINKKVQSSASKSSKAFLPSQIPRFTAFSSSKKNQIQKPVTPGNKNWTKIHKKEFSKFESIDAYLDRKKQRQDQLSSSAKKSLPYKSPTKKPTIVKPVNRNFGPAKIFQPQVTSVKNISFNFSKMASSSVKTPIRQAATPAASQKSSKQTSVHNKAPGNKGTPFKFTGNTSSLKKSSPAKTAFDLKASLARPLSWKPHTGKLQPLDVNKQQSVHTRRPKGSQAHRALASKTRSAQVKQVSRTAVMDRRSNQKYIDMMKKRGLIA